MGIRRFPFRASLSEAGGLPRRVYQPTALAEGIKLDEPVRKGTTGSTITYITDPWGTRIEIVQRAPLGPQVSTN